MTLSSLLPLTLALLGLAFVATAVLIGRRELRALAELAAQPLHEPFLVVIPARNEAERIGPTLRALLADPSPSLRVLVVDDRSSDATADVVEELARSDARVRLLRLAEDPAPGVFGKPRALQAAVRDARDRGELSPHVLFLDADVILQPGTLGGLVELLRREGAAAISGVPRLVCESRVEELLVPTLVSLVTARFSPRRVHAPMDPTAFLNGQLIAVRTAALDDVGGWSAVERTVLEDVALARALKTKGHPLRLVDLRRAASTRMYTSLAEIDAGFGKNATDLLGRGAGIVGGFSLAVSLLPWTALVLASFLDEAASSTVVAVLFAATLGLQLAARRSAGAPLWPVFVLPVSYLGATLVLGRASLRALTGSPISWRDRRYPSAR